MVTEAKPQYFPEPPSKKAALVPLAISVGSRFFAATQLARLGTEHAADALVKYGVGSGQLNEALNFMNTVNTLKTVSPWEFVPSVLFIASRYVDPEHYDPRPSAPSWFKTFFGGLHSLVGAGATGLAYPIITHFPEMAREFATSIAQHAVTTPELIAVSAETAIAAYGVFSFIEAGKRIVEWATYPNLEARRQKKANAIKRSRELFAEEIKPPTTRTRTNTEILDLLRVRSARKMKETIEKIEQNHPSNTILDHHHAVIKGVLADLRGAPKDIPHFLKFEHRQTSNRLNQQKR